MRRFVSVAALTAACALALAAGAGSTGSKDYTGPTCNNFTGGDGTYTTYGGTEAFVVWNATTEAPTCSKTSYTLYALTASGGTQVAAQALAGGTSMACPDGAPATTSCVAWTIDLGPAAAAPSSICIYATSSSSNNVSDRAPDASGSCIGLLLNTSSSGGGTGFN